MTSKKSKSKQTRKQYPQDYKNEALALAERIGVAAAAKQLGLHKSQLYAWRTKARQNQARGEAERQLATENARLKRELAQKTEELAILKKAAAYFESRNNP